MARNGRQPESLELKEFCNNIKNLENFIKSEIRYAQKIASENVNKSRQAPPLIKRGDQVWLLRRHISTTRPSNKLDHKRLGPFKVSKKISSHAYCNGCESVGDL